MANKILGNTVFPFQIDVFVFPSPIGEGARRADEVEREDAKGRWDRLYLAARKAVINEIGVTFFTY